MKKNLKIALAAASVLLFAVISSLLYTHTAFFPKTLDSYHCPFKVMTGYPCATCGFTRCVLYTGAGRFREAFLVSPLAFTIFVYLFLTLSANLIFFISGSSRSVLWPWKIKPQKAAVLMAALLLISWVYKLSSAVH